MATTDKEYRLKITGDSRELGRSTKEAAAALNTLKQEAVSLGSALTGGLFGGGISGAVLFAVNRVAEVVREARQLVIDAEHSDISSSSAQLLKNQGRVLGLADGSLLGAIGTARQQRSEALAGAPEAAKAFESLGLSLKRIKDLEPDNLFLEIVQSLRPDATSAQRAAFRTLLGAQAGAELEGFAAGGFFRSNRALSLVELSQDFNDRAIGVSPDNLDALIRKRFKADFEPLAQYGVGSENRAAKLDEELRQRVLNLSRQQLTIEERIKAVTEERDSILSRAAAETNVERRRRLELRAVDYEAELLQLSAVPVSQPAASGESATPSDQFTRVGRYLFGAGAGSVDVGRQSLQTLKDVKTILEKAPSEIGRSVADNL